MSLLCLDYVSTSLFYILPKGRLYLCGFMAMSDVSVEAVSHVPITSQVLSAVDMFSLGASDAGHLFREPSSP